MIISRHAAERWIERVEPHLDIAGAEKAIQAYEKIIRLAIELGATAVKLGCGARLVIAGGCVVTVIGKR